MNKYGYGKYVNTETKGYIELYYCTARHFSDMKRVFAKSTIEEFLLWCESHYFSIKKVNEDELHVRYLINNKFVVTARHHCSHYGMLFEVDPEMNKSLCYRDRNPILVISEGNFGDYPIYGV